MSGRGNQGGRGQGGGGGYQGGRGYQGGQGGGRGYQGGQGGGGGPQGGRGYQGGQGGQGGGRGYQGGQGGGGGGYQQGGRGRGDGGGFQGGRGRGDGGGFQGGRGRGGGGFQGGRGRGRGALPTDNDVYGANKSVPVPDPAITALEDKLIQVDVSTTMADLSVSKDGRFPVRPAFGTEGQPVVLWANYFKVDLKDKKGATFYKYSLTVNKPGEKPTPEASSETRPVAGKKLEKVIRAALDFLGPKIPIASEFKQQVVTTKKLELPADGVVKITLSDTAKPEQWNVNFNGPELVQISELQKFLATMVDRENQDTFPKRPVEIDALNVVIGHTARADSEKVAVVGKGRFFAAAGAQVDAAPLKPSRFGDAPRERPIQILRGYSMSVRPGTGRLLANTNVTHGVFRNPVPLSELFKKMGLAKMETCEDFARYGRQLKDVNRVLSRARVEHRIPPSKKGGLWTKINKAIAGLCMTSDGKKGPKDKPSATDRAAPKFDGTMPGFDFSSARYTSFLLDAPKDSEAAKLPPPKGLKFGQYCTVEQFFKARYDITLDVNLPLINTGTRQQPIYIPAEHITILPGQPLKMKLSPDEQDDMINFACRSPKENALSIASSARQLLGLDNNPLLRSFGLEVDKQLITVPGRVLTPPTIRYLNKDTTPMDGSWQTAKLLRPCNRIEKWAWIHFETRAPVRQQIQDSLDTFTNLLFANQGIEFRPAIRPAGMYASAGGGAESIESKFAALVPKQQLQLIIVVLPNITAELYNRVKLLGDVKYGVPTLCMQQQKLAGPKGPNLTYVVNVGVKLNLKLGGQNHQLKESVPLINSGETMVVGYDVTHPTNLAPRAGKNAPSLVGLVASVDKLLNQWPAYVWSMTGKREMLDEELVRGFKSRLELWRKRNSGKLPKNLVIFRDGVSEGQFAQVIEKELPFIRQACAELYGKNTPRITLIVSVKRHQTRFYPTNSQGIHKASHSPKDGTVVDRGVTGARTWDFFVQAHASLKGTARPAHYTVLVDEIFRADYKQKAANALEQLTYFMCFQYGRATKAVSICPPAYYADLVCTRARAHNQDLFEGSDTASLASGAAGPGRTNTVHKDLQDTMYYV